MIGFHPSDLPNYAGGSPIQNQILDGVKDTKMSLFKLNSKIDKGEILFKEYLNLEGGMTDIFDKLTDVSLSLLSEFFDNYPNVELVPQKGKGKRCRRLKPKDSNITLEQIRSMTTEQLYDFIRCREDPYPNVYLEDEIGKIYFKSVRFEKKL